MSLEPTNARTPIFNLANQLTCLRLVLAVAMFCLIPWGTPTVYLVALGLFLLAAGTDWADGYVARRFGLVTQLGRILDPFADKVTICGTFILLAAVPRMIETPWGLHAWMVVIVVGRELLVTALRSFLEEHGADFSARRSGKLKMLLQCAAASLSLLYLAFSTHAPGQPEWLWWPMVVSIWAAVILTIISGMVYVTAAVKLLRSP